MPAGLAQPLDAMASEKSDLATAIRKGDAVIADDGVLGCVDGVIEWESRTPAYVVVRVGHALRRRYPVVPVSFVAAVDVRRRHVRLRGRRKSIGRLSESLPIVL